MEDRLSQVERAETSVAEVIAEFPGLAWSDAADAIERRILFGAERAASSAESPGAGLVDALHARDPGVFSEPHLLGWIHQYLGTAARREAFEAHTRREEKHADTVVATQIYTPRWVADLLVHRAMRGFDAPQVADPACGGGQFLLAAFERMIEQGVEAEFALRRLFGGDLDPTAVDATRRSLVLIAHRHGVDLDEARRIVGEQITVADALDLEGTFDVVVTNPPYMGHRSMPNDLRTRLKSDFRPFHLDLASAVTYRCAAACSGSLAILSQQNVWFLKRFEEARRELLSTLSLDLFVHFGPHLFEVLKGEKASVVGFVMRRREDRPSATFCDLRDIDDPAEMRRMLVHGERSTERDVSSVTRLPGAPMAHWLPPVLADSFELAEPLGERFEVPGSQNKTGRNRKYVRKASEVDPRELAPLEAASTAGRRWRYYSKGGRYAPWWGNWDNVVDWSEEARAFYQDNRTSNCLDERWIDRVGLVYTDFGGRTFNARWKPKTALFDMAGPAIFHPEDDEDELAALLVYLNSEPARMLLNALNPSLHYQVRDVRALPLPNFEENLPAAAELGHRLVELARLVDEDQLGVDGIDELRRLEVEANALACRAFGVSPSAELPLHSKLK